MERYPDLQSALGAPLGYEEKTGEEGTENAAEGVGGIKLADLMSQRSVAVPVDLVYGRKEQPHDETGRTDEESDHADLESQDLPELPSGPRKEIDEESN